MGGDYGLSDDYEYFEFSLDSLDASYSNQAGTASSDWPVFEVAGKGPLKDIVAIKILDAQIPFSWYVFNSVNQNFLMREGAGVDQTITIPIGNYTATSLAVALQAAIVAVFGNHYNVTYLVSLQKFRFSKVSGAATEFTFTYGAPAGIPGVQPNSGNTNPRLWMGFPPGSTTSVSQVMDSPNCDLVSGASYLYVNSSRIGSDVDMYLPQGAFNLGGGKAGPQMAKVAINANPGGVITWLDPDPQKWFKFDQLQSLNNMDFFLTLGNTTSQYPLQLNGLGFSLKLGVLKLQRMSLDIVDSTMQNGRIARREGPKRLRK